jgi:hypothetical protein
MVCDGDNDAERGVTGLEACVDRPRLRLPRAIT